jgi:uncharacterized protein (DUF362 family)/Pyruvate/2-oxoacid:ferredoxin oxidoreductase delta subunit
MVQVSLVKCTEYHTDLLEDAIGQSLANIGFPLKDFENKNVALKPNFLMTSAVDKAIITHPAFFRAVARIVRDHGGRVVLVESPAMESVKRVMKKGEYLSIVEELDVTVPSNGRKGVILNPNDRRFKRFEVLGPVVDADIIINLPKLKTHGLTTITCAVKNLFGLIPGLEKSQWHMKAPGKEAFAELLLDLNEALMYGSSGPKPILHLVDAVVGQEGNGPGPSGTPRKIGAVLASTSPVAVDLVAADLLGFDYRAIPSVVGGLERNLGLSSPAEIDRVGEDINRMRVDHFKPARHSISTATYDRWPFNRKGFRNLLTSKPLPQGEKCTLCYQCKAICPAGAIEKADGSKNVPRYDYDKCIRCYCCMEICPEAAVELRSGALEWMISSF